MYADQIHAALSLGTQQVDYEGWSEDLCRGPVGGLDNAAGDYVPVVVRMPDGSEHQISRVSDRGVLGLVIEVAP